MAEIKISLAKLISTVKLESVEGITSLNNNKGDMFFFSYPNLKVKITKRN